jgi:hypothetical protein
MSIMEMYDEFEVYFEECEGDPLRTNFDENMPLSQFMEDHGSGFSIRDSEEVITIGPDGTESELRGFHENRSPEMNIYVQEILDTVGPDQGEGAGPFEVDCDFLLEDYIMFRTSSHEEGWNQNTEEFYIKKGTTIRWNLDPVSAIEMAQWLFEKHKVRYEHDHLHASNRAVELYRMDPNGLHLRYLNWVKNNYRIVVSQMDALIGFKFDYEPVIEDLMTVNDAKLTVCEQYDEAFLDEQEQRETAESRYWDCFKENGEKELCGEEFVYRARLKEARWERTATLLSWIEKNSTRTVSEAFARGGIFDKTLRESRQTCLPPSKNWRTRFKTPAEVYLTKQQADFLKKAAEKKSEGALDISFRISLNKMWEESNKKKEI